MTALTSAIVSHDLPSMAMAIASDRSQINQAVNGWLPIEWAQRTGNLVTLVRFYRLTDNQLSNSDTKDLLLKYLTLLGSDEFEPCSLTETANMLWEALFNGKTYTVGRWKRPLFHDIEQGKDLEFLINAGGYKSQNELLGSLSA